MKLKDLSKEDLETMSYTEITTIILTEKGSKMKIVDVFKKICEALELSDQEFENKIADYFELITTDKNFIILDKGYCDLKTRHNKTVIIEDDEENSDADEVETTEEETDESSEDSTDEDIFYDDQSDDDDIDDEDLDDFVVVDDEDEASI